MKIEWSKFDDEVLKGVDLCKQINGFGYEAYIVGGCVSQKEGITGQRFGKELHDRMLKKYKDAYRV